jgi:addiction module HigA family antidote
MHLVRFRHKGLR